MTDPAWIAVARALVGTREVPGAGNSPVIMKMAAGLGSKILGIAYGGDHVPWCGLFAAHCINAIGLKPPPIAIRASAWATWGVAVRPCVGAVLVFSRPGGGHVGFYVGEDPVAFFVLGGNQGDAVKIIRIEKNRMVASRWPAGKAVTSTAVVIKGEGGALSRNEA